MRYQNDPTDPDSLSGDSVMSITRDGSGTIWIGTWTAAWSSSTRAEGVLRFIHSRHDPFDADGLDYADIVWPVLEDDSGMLWVDQIDGGLE